MKFRFLPYIFVVFRAEDMLSQDAGQIEWKENSRLTWEDFHGPVNDSSAFLAYTDYTINYSYEVDPNAYKAFGSAEKEKFVYAVNCYFNQNLSWRKVGVSYLLLQHEQLHFDIAELHARKLRKMLHTIRDPGKGTEREVSKIFDQGFRDCNKMQRLYDRETNHSKNEEKQNEWNNTVTRELKKLDKYRKEN